jgi:hypothetical protein
MRMLFVAVGVVAVTLAPAFGTRAADGDVESVLAAAAQTLGASHLSNVPSIHVRATGHQLGLPATTDAYTDLASGGANATYARLGRFSLSSGYDEQAAWTRDQSGVVWVDGSEQGHAAAANEAYRESYALWTASHGGAAVALQQPRSERNVTFDVVRVKPPGSVISFDVWIDRTTHLPARYVETAAAVTTTTQLSDYRSVNGVELPFSVRQSSDDGNHTDSIVMHIDVAPIDIAAKIRKAQTDVHDFSIAGGDETSVPFDLIDNHVYLDVLLNGKGPYRFIFDTGGQNLIDESVAREIGATAAGNIQGSGVGAATEQFAFAPVASLRFGAAELRDQLFVVAPIRAGFGVSGSAPVDGLIGAEVLARFVTVFDYTDHRIIFKHLGSVASGASIPFVFDGTQPQIPCEIDRIATQCTIDSGSRASLDLFSPFIAANAAVVPANASAPGINGFGVGGADIGRLGRLSSLKIGAFDLQNLVAGLSAATAGAFAVPGIGANIGGGVLKRFTVTFDYPHQTMSLLPNHSLETNDSYERSGMFVVNSGTFVVAGVRPGTPASAAGIVKGDTIVSLDGTPAAQLTLGLLRDAFRRPSQTRLQLGILSEGAANPRTVVLTLRDYV